MLAAAASITSCGCGRQCHCINGFQRDSVYFYEKDTTLLRDTLVLYQIPEGYASVVVAVTDTAQAQTSLAEAKAWADKSGLHVTLRNRDESTMPLHVPFYINIHESEHSIIRESEKILYKEKQLSRWQVFRITVGDISIILLCVAVLIVIAWVLINKPVMRLFAKK